MACSIYSCNNQTLKIWEMYTPWEFRPIVLCLQRQTFYKYYNNSRMNISLLGGELSLQLICWWVELYRALASKQKGSAVLLRVCPVSDRRMWSTKHVTRAYLKVNRVRDARGFPTANHSNLGFCRTGADLSASFWRSDKEVSPSKS